MKEDALIFIRLSKERKIFLTQKLRACVKKQPKFRLLAKRLLKAGGVMVVACHEPDLRKELYEGREFSGYKIQTHKLQRNNCHENSKALAKRKGLKLATGWGLSKDGLWRQHTFCTDENLKIIHETTEKRIKYYGVIL